MNFAGNAANPSMTELDKEIRYYCALVSALIDTMEDAERQINPDMRIRMHGALLDIHANEFSQLRQQFDPAELSLALDLLPLVVCIIFLS